MGQSKKPLRLGIVMAGAVSAGAYQGGVIDYFLQIMDAWEKAKLANDPNVPTHDVRLDIISGASAGGMTSGMIVAALQQKHAPVTTDKRGDEAYKKTNVLYNAWVNLMADEMLPLLLSTDDIKREGKVISALNADFIKQIADREINPQKCTESKLPSYVNPNMEVLLTLTNLAGFQYRLFFTGADTSYHAMSQHKDFASFRLGKTYTGNGRIPLDINAGIGDAELRQAAPATGAFPVGLAYRQIQRKKKYIFENEDLLFAKKASGSPDARDIAANAINYQLVGYSDDPNYNPEEVMTTFHVDGGLINNQPFDLSMKIMNRMGATTEAITETDFDSTILMIDPFPAVESVFHDGKLVPDAATPVENMTGDFPFSLMAEIGKVFGSMRGQLLFKGQDIVDAFNDENFSRFLISPSGDKLGNTYEGSKAIACGCMDGFGGFIDKSFREHDFYLGRANAQNFFRWHFVVKLGDDMKPINPIFTDNYPAAAVTRFKFQYEKDKKTMGANAPWYVPMIPDLFYDGTDKTEEKAPEFPKYDMSTFDKYRGDVLNRMDAIASNMLSGWIKRFYKIYFFLCKKSLYEKLRGVIEGALQEWKLVPRK